MHALKHLVVYQPPSFRKPPRTNPFREPSACFRACGAAHIFNNNVPLPTKLACGQKKCRSSGTSNGKAMDTTEQKLTLHLGEHTRRTNIQRTGFETWRTLHLRYPIPLGTRNIGYLTTLLKPELNETSALQHGSFNSPSMNKITAHYYQTLLNCIIAQ